MFTKKLMKFMLLMFLAEMVLAIAFTAGVSISARKRLGHHPDHREFRCEGRRFFELFGDQHWPEDIGCGK
jgi:hypothetical protein